MQELTTTRHNHLIDPGMHVWSWEIPVYLFLGGLVAGMMIITGYFLLNKKAHNRLSIVHTSPLLNIVLLSLGMFSLFLDLEHKLYVWRLYTTFKPFSPMSWGSWILLLVYPTLIAGYLLNKERVVIRLVPFLWNWSKALLADERKIRTVAYLHIGMGILLGMYTGVLLSTMGSRPLWNSSILWLLFLVSGLSTGAALLHLRSKDPEEGIVLMKADNLFIVAELVVIALLFIGLLSSSAVHIAAARLLISGPYAPQFWVFVIFLGTLLPLLLQVLQLRNRVLHTAIPALLVLGGGLILRFIIVFAGQFSHYMNAHFQ